MSYLIGFIIGIVTLGSALIAHAANRSGSVLLSQVSPPEVCTEIYQPVCGTDENGNRKTYSNACFARIAKAINVTPGECRK
jgi:hypothetical protein